MGMSVDAYVGFAVDLGDSEDLTEAFQEKLEELWGKAGVAYTHTGYDHTGRTVVYAQHTVKSVEWGEVAELKPSEADTISAQAMLDTFFDALGIPSQAGRWLLWATYG